MAKRIDYSLKPIKCGDKIRYDDENVAKRKARKSAQISGEDWSAYRCQFCGFFHIGHTPQTVRSRKEREKRRRARVKARNRELRLQQESMESDEAQETGRAVFDSAGAADPARESEANAPAGVGH